MQDTMNLVGHLGELRKRLMITMAAFVVSLAAAFCFVKPIYDWLTRGLEVKLALLGPSDILWVYMLIAAVFAAAATMPVLAYQLWAFVKPAFTEREHQAAFRMIPAVTMLFIVGICFGYFVVFPVVYAFLGGLSDGQFDTVYTAEKYFTFMVHMTLPFGVLFEMPAAVLFLTKLGILNPQRLAKARKGAYFVLVIVGVIVTPPDLVSDILVIVPLLLLYECSISLSRIVYRRRLQQQEREEQAERSEGVMSV
ncbi:twin-arginine translocase subunit TatC [Paenibacillus sp. 1P07SE]|uniref:twin-arginine translocase subunit TatC n=1 Tax=Paenibacillus sp. 1P07SE TaxID=3132209 RepID=UPI0039A69C51